LRKNKQDVEGGEQRELVVRKSGGSNIDASRVGNARQESPTDEERAIEEEQVLRMYREAKAAKRRKDKELEDMEMDLQHALVDCVRGANGSEGFYDDADGAKVWSQQMQEHQKLLEKLVFQKRRLEKLASEKRGQEGLASQKRSEDADKEPESEKEDLVDHVDEESVTESESDQDMPAKPAPKKRSLSLSISEPELVVGMQIQATQLSSGEKRVSCDIYIHNLSWTTTTMVLKNQGFPKKQRYPYLMSALVVLNGVS
jgi:hypothetical protein